MLLACSGGSDTPAPPTATPEATATVQPKSNGPCNVGRPNASLRHSDQTLPGSRLSVNWTGPGCPVSAHPIDKMPIPLDSMRLAPGERPVLAFTDQPLSADGSIVALPLEFATPVQGGLQIPLDDFDRTGAEPLELEPVLEQPLVLPLLTPGDYFLQVGSTWPDGRLGFAFRIKIVEAVSE